MAVVRIKRFFWPLRLCMLAGAIGVAFATGAFADCTLTNIGKLPLPEMGHRTYQGYSTGLYPNYANNRPPAHLAAAIAIATNGIAPLDANGNVNTNTGKIALVSVGMSNTTHEFASGDRDTHDTTRAFKFRADNDPAKNPRVILVDGAQGGQDAIDWTNVNAATWSTLKTRLQNAGVSTQQVQVAWIKQSLQQITQYGVFPAHAQELERDLEIIARNLKRLFPNIKLTYVSSRTRCYSTNNTATNPEPYSWEAGFATKWLIEKQITGAPELNYDPAMGTVKAPLLSWGPYLWVDGLNPRSDGLVWQCDDVVNDFTHPSSNGVHKVATQLLAFFKTDPTTTPWFLRQTVVGSPPTCVASADVTNGLAPLTVNFSSAMSGSVTQTFWTFDDGTFLTNANPVKIFRTPGQYTARVTAMDTNGNTALSSVAVTVNTTFDGWRTNKFTESELADPAISGAAANPDLDLWPNLLEYAMGLEPKTSSATTTVSMALSNGVFSLSFPRLKSATDVMLTAEASSNLAGWTAITPSQTNDLGPIEALMVQEHVSTNSARFFRLLATRL